jgi:hypothetical protein
VPGPTPDPPEVTVIQLGPSTVSYPQPAGVATSTDPADAPAATEALYGLRPTVQSTPDWLTVNARPAIVALSTREPGVGFGGTVTVIEPLPVPAAGDNPRGGTDPLDAVHPQAPLEAVMTTVAEPPAAVADKLAGLMAKEHAVPNCVTVWTAPFTVTVAVRASGSGLGAAA